MQLANRDIIDHIGIERFSRLRSSIVEEFMAWDRLGLTVPSEFWNLTQRQYEEETLALLLLVFSMSSDQHGAGEDQTGAIGRRWSDSQSKTAADQFRQNTQVRYEEWKKKRGFTPYQRVEPAPAPGPVPVAPAPTPSPVAQPVTPPPEIDIDSLFNVSNFEAAAISFITDATSAGSEAAMTVQDLISDDDIWWTEADGHVCLICGPLHKTTRKVWGLKFPNGPKAHIRCRCWIEYKQKIPQKNTTQSLIKS